MHGAGQVTIQLKRHQACAFSLSQSKGILVPIKGNRNRRRISATAMFSLLHD